MAWEALKAAIPAALIQILVEKLVSMIVPAAGAIMAIIEGLRAAWASASRILQAMQRFIAFLKAVKSGNAGPAFGASVAAGAVAVIDFVANWLLTKIKGAASKVGDKIKSIAQKILARLKKVGSKVVGAVKRGAGRVMNALGNTKVGQVIKQGYERVTNLVNKGKERFDTWRNGSKDPQKPKTPAEEAAEKQDRLDKAVAAIQPKVQALLQRGVSGLRLRAQLAFWRVQYRLTSLDVTGKNPATITAVVNPKTKIGEGYEVEQEELLKFVREVHTEVMAQEEVRKGAERITVTHEAYPGNTVQPHIHVPHGVGYPAFLMKAQQMEHRGLGTGEVVSFEGPDKSITAEQYRRQGRGRSEDDSAKLVRNKIVTPMINGSLQQDGLDYKAIARTLESVRIDGQQASPAAIDEAIRRFSRSHTVPKGFDIHQVGLLSTLLGATEPHRNPAALTMNVLAGDIATAYIDDPTASNGRRQHGWLQTIDMLPMAPRSAQKKADALNSYLDTWKPDDSIATWMPPDHLLTKAQRSDDQKRKRGVSETRRSAAEMMSREIAWMEAWIRTLNLVFDSKASAEAKKEQFKQEIRRRFQAVTGIEVHHS